MREHGNTGWRAAPPVYIDTPVFEAADRAELFETARLAKIALKLRPSAAHVLDQLIGCFREPVSGRLLVWPANELLMDRTGLSERAVRYAIAELTRAGLVRSRDSANGKRFAVRAKNGQIIDAFGLDLAPLLSRKQELQAKVDRFRELREARKRAFDEITICRRQAEALLAALDDAQELADALARTKLRTPRRDSLANPEPSLAEWRALLEVIEQHHRTACGGKDCRFIENNNDSPDQSCSNGQENGERPQRTLQLVDLAAACPNAFEYVKDVYTTRELVSEAARLRGAMGVHESAWTEAVEKLGPIMAAASFFVTLQHYCADQAGRSTIRNYGGYFRAWMRRVAAGELDLGDEIRGMRRRRAN